jgi:hypothetical protein
MNYALKFPALPDKAAQDDGLSKQASGSEPLN